MTPQTRSIQARLLSVSKARGEDFNLVLTRYALERWLYRLSVSDAAGDFVLKGALLFSLWFNQTSRPTRDADFLGLGAPDQTTLRARFQTVCGVLCDDGMVYDAGSVAVSEIRNEALYSGLHAEVLATLGSARSVVRVDVGFGDAVTPAPQQEDYPTLLPDMPRPRLHVYPRETVVAEKLEAIITLGVRNSRLKDYFDLWVLLVEGTMDDGLLGSAIAATCARRKTSIPPQTPLGLTEQFGEDPSKQAQWKAFLDRNRLGAPSLPAVIEQVRRALVAPLKLSRGNTP